MSRRSPQGPIGAELLEKLKAKGIIGLAFWNNGFKILSANKPLISPDDVLGLKMRIQASKVIEEQMVALGALPQVMAFSEAYQALASGVVDGTENTPANMLTQKMFEVQKNATLTNHGYLGYAVIVNQAFWEGLPRRYPRRARAGDKGDDPARQSAGARGKRAVARRDAQIGQDGFP